MINWPISYSFATVTGIQMRWPFILSELGIKSLKKKEALHSMKFSSLENHSVLIANMKRAANCDIAAAFGNMKATHCEYSVQRHLPNSTSWWTLCSTRSRSSASRAGQSPPHTSCGNTPSVSMQASAQTATEEVMTREISGRGGNESRHNHISCAAGLSGGPEW